MPTEAIRVVLASALCDAQCGAGAWKGRPNFGSKLEWFDRADALLRELGQREHIVIANDKLKELESGN